MGEQTSTEEYEKMLINGYIQDYYNTTGKKLIVYEQRGLYFNKKKNETEAHPIIDNIYQLTKKVFKIDCLLPVRDNERVQIRMILYQMARERGCSLVSIGKYTSRDHTTILHALNSKVATYPEYIQKLNKFRRLLKRQDAK